MDLSEGMKINTRIKKPTAQMEMLKDFFSCRDIDKRVKYWIYIGGPLNTLPAWGAKFWCIMDQKVRKT